MPEYIVLQVARIANYSTFTAYCSCKKLPCYHVIIQPLAPLPVPLPSVSDLGLNKGGEHMRPSKYIIFKDHKTKYDHCECQPEMRILRNMNDLLLISVIIYSGFGGDCDPVAG